MNNTYENDALFRRQSYLIKESLEKILIAVNKLHVIKCPRKEIMTWSLLKIKLTKQLI